MIELKHINKIYNGFNALNDISLTIKDGEIYNQIYRGSMSNDDMYQKISFTLSVLASGGEELE